MKATVLKPVFNTDLLKPGTVVVLKEKNLKPKYNCLVKECFESDVELVYVLPSAKDDTINISIDEMRDGKYEIEVIKENDFMKQQGTEVA